MLIRFVYLDRPTLAGYVAQLDGGLIAETKVRLVKKASVGGHIDAKFLGAKAEGGKENEQFLTMSYPAEAQFQRVLAVANDDPDKIDWIEVVDPNANFGSAQVGETIAWECDVDIHKASRMAARGGGGAKLAGLLGLMIRAQATGLNVGGQRVEPKKAHQMKQQVEVIQELLDSLNVSRVAVGRDDETGWSVFGSLYDEHLQVPDIDNERLIVVGKIKKILKPGESRRVVITEALQLMEMLPSRSKATPTDQSESEIAGPALELDILAIYR